MRGNMAYWVGGTLAAFLGVALVKLLAPALAGVANSLAVVAGYFLVIAGITIVAHAAGRNGAKAALAIEKQAKE